MNPKYTIADTMTAKDRARALPLPEEVRKAVLPWVNRQIQDTPQFTRADLMTEAERATALPPTNEIQRAILSQAGAGMGNDFTVGDILTDEEKALALPIMSEVHLAILPRIVPVAAGRAVAAPEAEEALAAYGGWRQDLTSTWAIFFTEVMSTADVDKTRLLDGVWDRHQLTTGEVDTFPAHYLFFETTITPASITKIVISCGAFSIKEDGGYGTTRIYISNSRTEMWELLASHTGSIQLAGATITNSITDYLWGQLMGLIIAGDMWSGEGSYPWIMTDFAQITIYYEK